MLVILSPSRVLAFVSAAWAAAAAWCSFGTIAIDAPGGARIGLLPRDPVHLVLVALCAVVVGAIAWRGPRGSQAALTVAPLVLVLLPWLPFHVPAAFLIWTGGFVTLPWLACAVGLAAVALRDWHLTLFGPARVQAIMAGILSGVVFSLAAWCVSPVLPGGDEPHYLVVTQSLLYDHDLEIENNHARGDYRAYFAGNLAPDFIRRGRNGAIYSIHAPGVPAVVLPAFAIAGYRGVVVFLILAASAACALAWWLAWRCTGSSSAAWFGWAAVALSAPFLLESFTVYPDGVGAAVVLTGVWALLRGEWERDARQTSVWPWLLHGVALASLPWLHTRFAVLAATLGGLVLIRLSRSANPTGKAVAFLAAPAVSAVAWMFFFAIVYGTPDPSAPYGRSVDNSFAFLPDGLGGLLFDQGFGLLATAPVLVIALAGFVRARRLAADYLVLAVPYLLAVTTFAMWWAGVSGPARFAVPLVLPLAIPAACAWQSWRSRGARAVLAAALIVSCWIAAMTVVPDRGRLAYHARNDAGLTAAPYVESSNHLLDLPSALPAFVPLPIGSAAAAREAAARSGFSAALVWIVCAGAAAWAVYRRARRGRGEDIVATASCAGGAATMIAATVVWSLTGAAPMAAAPAQMDTLRHLGAGRQVVLDLTARRRIAPDSLVGRMRIAVDVRPGGRGAARGGRPLAALPLVPAGEYEVYARARGESDGWLMTGVGADQFALVTQPIPAYEHGVRLRLPLDVRSITVRGDEDAREDVSSVELHPVRLFGPAERAADGVARRAVRYTTSTVFLLDDRTFPEPGAFWIGGARESSIVIAPDAPKDGQPMLLRNAPVANTVTIEAGAWRRQFAMAPGEERQVVVPIDAARGAALVTIGSSAGFRPAEADPASRDTRYLGVYIRIE